MRASSGVFFAVAQFLEDADVDRLGPSSWSGDNVRGGDELNVASVGNRAVESGLGPVG
jgi:hypothetical protein